MRCDHESTNAVLRKTPAKKTNALIAVCNERRTCRQNINLCNLDYHKLLSVSRTRTDRLIDLTDCTSAFILDTTARLKQVWNLRFVANRQLLNTSSLFFKSNYATTAQSTALRSLSVYTAHKTDATRMLNVTWNNDTVSRYPLVSVSETTASVPNVPSTRLIGKLIMESTAEGIEDDSVEIIRIDALTS